MPTYTVTYRGNGADSGETTDNTAYAPGTTATVKENGFTRSRYTFTGWNMKADGSGTPYKTGDKIPMPGSVILYAQWPRNSSHDNDDDKYFFAIQKVDAQDDHALNGAVFELYQRDSRDNKLAAFRKTTSHWGPESGLALFRVSAFGKLGIMFPMVTSVWEVREAKRMCEEVRRELKNEGIPYSEDVQIGIMIETPAAAINSARLAKEVDIFSIGTTDLTQYTLACDRQTPSLERFAAPHSPAVLRMIQMTIEAAHRHGIWCGICGELGADLSLTDTFLRLGIDELSVSPTSVLPLRNVIRNH